MRASRIAIAVLLAAIMGIAVTACGNSGGSSGGTEGSGSSENSGDGSGLKIGFLMYSSQQYASKFEQKGFEEKAHELGAEPLVQYAQADPAVQREQVEQMITNGVNAVVITAVDEGTACAQVREMQQAGIKVVAEKFPIADCEVEYLIQRDDHEVGIVTGEHALKEVPEGNYVIVSGDQATPVAVVDTKAYMEVLQPAIDAGKIKVVSQRYNTGWAPEKALEQVEQALTANSDEVAAILANNDEMALAALEAVRAQGLTGKVYISGQDADLANVQAILNEEMAFTTWTRWLDFGTLAAEASVALSEGTALPKGTETISNGSVEVPGQLMPIVEITKESIPGWLCTEKFYPVNEVYAGVKGAKPPKC